MVVGDVHDPSSAVAPAEAAEAAEPLSGPTVRRVILGAQLRRLREAKGVTREEAGYTIRGSASKISRVELGRVGFKERDVADLLTLYGVTDEAQRSQLLDLAREANEPTWWQVYGDIPPAWFETYLGLEQAASLIRAYEIQFVPGLLQTEDYARALAVGGHFDTSGSDVDKRVRLRMARQEILSRSDPPTLWMIIDESALRRPVGSRQIMQAQLTRLMDMAQRPSITLQVLPFRYGSRSSDGGNFTLLRFQDPDAPDVIYLEHLNSALYLDKPDQVEHYTHALDRLTLDAKPPNDTLSALSALYTQI